MLCHGYIHHARTIVVLLRGGGASWVVCSGRRPTAPTAPLLRLGKTTTGGGRGRGGGGDFSAARGVFAFGMNRGGRRCWTDIFHRFQIGPVQGALHRQWSVLRTRRRRTTTWIPPRAIRLLIPMAPSVPTPTHRRGSGGRGTGGGGGPGGPRARRQCRAQWGLGQGQRPCKRAGGASAWKRHRRSRPWGSVQRIRRRG